MIKGGANPAPMPVSPPVKRRSRAVVRLPWRNPQVPAAALGGGDGRGTSQGVAGRFIPGVAFFRSFDWAATGGTVAVHLALVGLALFWLVPVSVPARLDEDIGLPMDIQCPALAERSGADSGRAASPRALPMLAAPAAGGDLIGGALQTSGEESLPWADSADWPAPGSLTGGGFDGVPPTESGLGLQPARKADGANARRAAGVLSIAV